MSWDDSRRFGTPLPGFPVVVRPSAYGLVRDASGHVAVVRSIDGVFLPGGGIDEGESPEEALVREAGEECGWSVRVGEWCGRAIQFTLSGDGLVFYEKRCEFFDIVIDREGAAPIEPWHETLWVTPEEARSLLKHESHAWAIGEFVGP
ncbi:MAG: NUDIX domain-containing protein [Vicinamibacterales bacterium]